MWTTPYWCKCLDMVTVFNVMSTCIVTSLSSTMTSFVRKSAPIVALYWLLNFLFTYWFISEVLPTLRGQKTSSQQRRKRKNPTENGKCRRMEMIIGVTIIIKLNLVPKQVFSLPQGSLCPAWLTQSLQGWWLWVALSSLMSLSHNCKHFFNKIKNKQKCQHRNKN